MSILAWLMRRRSGATPATATGSAPATPPISLVGDREPNWTFDAEVAGTDLENDDGSIRQDIIRRTEIGQETLLIDLPTIPKLVAVFVAATGDQLGYLPRKVAQRILAESRRYEFRSFVKDIKPDVEREEILRVLLGIDVFEKPRSRRR
jgi:hypothetical protein